MEVYEQNKTKPQYHTKQEINFDGKDASQSTENTFSSDLENVKIKEEPESEIPMCQSFDFPKLDIVKDENINDSYVGNENKDICRKLDLDFLKEQSTNILHCDIDIKKEEKPVTIEDVVLCKKEPEDEATVGDNELCNSESSRYRCRKCGNKYKEYCSNCPMLCQILHNSVQESEVDWSKKTIPKNLLEIRHRLHGFGVFALKMIPKYVIFGPFEELHKGLSSIGTVWKIHDNKLVDVENCNWMQYINHAEENAPPNLSPFQYKNKLYYLSVREISKNEELLVHYLKEYLLNSSDGKEIYFAPPLRTDFPIIYSCTFCCLGFSLKKHLVKHKHQCPDSGKQDTEDILSIIIIQCPCCDIYLDKKEYQEYHAGFCQKFSSRICLQSKIANYGPRTADELSDLKQPKKDLLTVCEEWCSPRDAKLNENMENRHFSSSNWLRSLKLHVNPHLKSYAVEKKYKCYKCEYDTNFKQELQRHIFNHDAEIRTEKKNKLRLELKKKFRLKKLSVGKRYNCPKCKYGTDSSSTLSKHILVHDSRPYQCDLCQSRYLHQKSLAAHYRKDHPGSSLKEQD